MASIIKAAGQSTPAAFNLDDLSARAAKYLEQVKVDAAQLLQKAQQDAASLKAKAVEDGRREGRAEGMKAVEKLVDEKLKAELGTLLPALREAIGSIAESRQAWLRSWERQAVQVATAIAGRVIRSEVSRRPEIPLLLISEALELAAGCGQIELRLHPEDQLALRAQAEQLCNELTQVGKAVIVADAGVSKGSCRVTTAMGAIDQRFEEQLARIEQELSGD